jgi:hypothetical protein
MQASASATEDPGHPYPLQIDEINRADLRKILGEAIYLFEPQPESPRAVELAYDFGTPFHRRLCLPDNLHILGTMNSADRSVTIVDVAVRRRFGFLLRWPDSTAVAEVGRYGATTMAILQRAGNVPLWLARFARTTHFTHEGDRSRRNDRRSCDGDLQ